METRELSPIIPHKNINIEEKEIWTEKKNVKKYYYPYHVIQNMNL